MFNPLRIVLVFFIVMAQSCCDPTIPSWKKHVDFSLLDSLHNKAIQQHVRSYSNGVTKQIWQKNNIETQPSCKEFDSLVQYHQIISCGITLDSSISIWNIHTNRNPYASEGVIICRDCDSILSLSRLNKRLAEKDPLLLDSVFHYQPINNRYYWFSTFQSRGNISEVLFK